MFECIIRGVWHILPEKYKNWTAADDSTPKDKSDDDESAKDAVFDNLLAKGDCPVIVYAHGTYDVHDITSIRRSSVL